MKTKSIIFSLVLIFSIGLILQACTAFNIFIGSQIDKKPKKGDQEIVIGEIFTVKEDQLLELYLKDGSKKRGRYYFNSLKEDEEGNFTGTITIKKYKASEKYEAYQIEDVSQVMLLAPRSAQVILGAIGVLTDVTLVVIGLAFSGGGGLSLSGVGSNGPYSCPYIYSHNGTEYILDAEPFGGAIWKGGERMDWEVLQQIAEKNDAYQIKITNELEEIQYLNEVKLEVVDHPTGTKVYPDFYGDFHLIGKPGTPIKAYGTDGANLLPLVKEKDDYLWIANPLDKNSLQPNERASMVLEFEKPATAEHVKVHFNLQNTFWSSSFLKEFLKLYGEELDGLYTGLNASTQQSEALIQLMIREGMLDVKVWDGTRWLDGGFIWSVGPVMAKDKVLAFDLAQIKSSDLRIKLEAPPGFWAVNSITADYSSITDFSRQEIKATYATNHLGEDISRLLLLSDDQYYIMTDTACSAELSFPAPPARKGYERTVILKAQGYYQIKMEGQGPADIITIQRIQSEPGYLAQYANELFKKYAKEAVNQ